jgi:serine/threonine protein kinase
MLKMIINFFFFCEIEWLKACVEQKITSIYQAPEVLDGAAYEPLLSFYIFSFLLSGTSASDVWSLGVTLFEFITFRYPFEAPDTQSVVKRIKSDQLLFPQFPSFPFCFPFVFCLFCFLYICFIFVCMLFYTGMQTLGSWMRLKDLY